MSRPAFTRSEPDDRRRSLIEAAARALANKGAAGVSVRAISAEAGVSPGLLVHYFGGVDALIAETYRWVAGRVGGQLAAAVASAGDDPRARLDAYVTASFRPPIADPALLATWIAFWSLVKSNREIEALHAEIYAGYRAELEKLLAACMVQPQQARHGAIGLAALVDGLWLELCLAPGSFTPDEASGIARRWIDVWLG